MAYLALLAILLVLTPTARTAFKEFRNKNRFGAVGILVYLSLVAALAYYQIFVR